MAMIQCPECGKQISDKAATCPNCGCPVKEVINERDGLSAIRGYEASEHPVDYKRDKKKDSAMSIVAAVLTIFTFTLIFGIIVGLIDLGIYGRDGKRHIGSWFAIIFGIVLLVAGHGRIPILFL